MNTRHRFYSYRRNLPLSLLLFIFFLGIVAFTMLAILGLFIGIAFGAVAAGLILFRLLTTSREKKPGRLEDDGKTVVLGKDEYEVTRKVKNLK